MQMSAINPIMLGAGVLFCWLFVRMVRRGSVTSRLGVISREQSPALFWFVMAVNGLIALAALLLGFGILKK